MRDGAYRWRQKETTGIHAGLWVTAFFSVRAGIIQPMMHPPQFMREWIGKPLAALAVARMSMAEPGRLLEVTEVLA